MNVCKSSFNDRVEAYVIDYLAISGKKYGKFYGLKDFFEPGTIAHYIYEREPELFGSIEPESIPDLHSMTKKQLLDTYSSSLKKYERYGESLSKKVDIVKKIESILKHESREKRNKMLANRLSEILWDVLPCITNKVGWVYLRELEKEFPTIRINFGAGGSPANIFYMFLTGR